MGCWRIYLSPLPTDFDPVSYAHGFQQTRHLRNFYSDPLLTQQLHSCLRKFKLATWRAQSERKEISPAFSITSVVTVSDTEWHHIGCLINRGLNGQVYIDGRPASSTVTLAGPSMSTTAPIRIGAQSFATITNYLHGQVDDVRIYNYLVPTANVKIIYDEGAIVRFGPATGTP